MKVANIVTRALVHQGHAESNGFDGNHVEK